MKIINNFTLALKVFFNILKKKTFSYKSGMYNVNVFTDLETTINPNTLKLNYINENQTLIEYDFNGTILIIAEMESYGAAEKLVNAIKEGIFHNDEECEWIPFIQLKKSVKNNYDF